MSLAEIAANLERWQKRAERAEAECEKLRDEAAAEKATAEELHSILNKVIWEAQEVQRERDALAVQLEGAA